MAISRADLLKLAKAGAATRVQELRDEINDIYRSFPDLRNSRGRILTKGFDEPRRPGRRNWTAAQRKAAAERMRKYWAAKRNKSK
jgi:hypothetical protein